MKNATGMVKTRLRLHAALLAAMFLSPLLLSCSSEEKPCVKETFVMGTRCVITIYGMEQERASGIAGEAFHELHRLESMMSNWIGDSELSRLNAAVGPAPVSVSPELFEIIELSLRYSSLTGGAFDATARPIVRLWGFQRSEGEPGPGDIPTDGEIAAALGLCGYSRVKLDAEALTVTLPEGMQIDLAGIGKGYGVDRCVKILREGGVTSALVNLSGNMYAIGTPPGREGWSIGLRDPHGGNGIVGRFRITDEAVATSGNYENFVVIGDRRYGHIVDPRTGTTVDHLLSVTIVAPSAVEADALSTGFFVLGPRASREVADSLPGVRAAFALEDDSFEFIGGSAWDIEY
ncbi:MAG TPA: FAD:protein FMN transferase [Candidatus Krumholzibacterium sp.]|nr:FAD:protein FMN transferase [Candidatus Krumholzibacterium sp.]